MIGKLPALGRVVWIGRNVRPRMYLRCDFYLINTYLQCFAVFSNRTIATCERRCLIEQRYFLVTPLLVTPAQAGVYYWQFSGFPPARE